MSSKKKTSVRAGAKPTNKGSTAPASAKARKAAAAEIAERIERLDAAEDAAPTTAYADDGTLKTVSFPADEPASDPAESAPKAKGRKPKAPKTPRPAKAKPEKVKKVSGLDAAALVLAESATPMKAVDMLAEIQKRGLWASKGKTPEATLYAAIIREIAAKGNAARFRRHTPGMFVANAGKGE